MPVCFRVFVTKEVSICGVPFMVVEYRTVSTAVAMMVVNTPVENETETDARVPVSMTPLVVVLKVEIGIVLL